METRRVFVLGGYQPYAASYLIYHVGRILEERFGYRPVMVRTGTEGPEGSTFSYPRTYETIQMGELPGAVAARDLFLPVTAAWRISFGLTLGCRKLLYVQGVNTFQVLDGFMDGYVAVSSFVQKSLNHLYDIQSPVINPFIELDKLPPPLDWASREESQVVLFVKPPQIADALVGAFTSRLSRRHPGLRPAIRVIDRGIPHAELMALLARTRYVVGLSPTEGFGLVPLEAMASGCAVACFHGGGGLDYMHSGNCRAVTYPAMDDLVDGFAELYSTPRLAEALAARGKADARAFTMDLFEERWTRYLRDFGA